jgi:hypothetical protein
MKKILCDSCKEKEKKAKQLSFSNENTKITIPRKEPESREGLHLIEELNDVQQDCVMYVMDSFGAWDREELLKRKLNPKEKKLVDICLRALENKRITKSNIDDIVAFAKKKQEKRDAERKRKLQALKEEEEEEGKKRNFEPENENDAQVKRGWFDNYFRF